MRILSVNFCNFVKRNLSFGKNPDECSKNFKEIQITGYNPITDIRYGVKPKDSYIPTLSHFQVQQMKASNRFRALLGELSLKYSRVLSEQRREFDEVNPVFQKDVPYRDEGEEIKEQFLLIDKIGHMPERYDKKLPSFYMYNSETIRAEVEILVAAAKRQFEVMTPAQRQECKKRILNCINQRLNSKDKRVSSEDVGAIERVIDEKLSLINPDKLHLSIEKFIQRYPQVLADMSIDEYRALNIEFKTKYGFTCYDDLTNLQKSKRLSRVLIELYKRAPFQVEEFLKDEFKNN